MGGVDFCTNFNTIFAIRMSINVGEFRNRFIWIFGLQKPKASTITVVETLTRHSAIMASMTATMTNIALELLYATVMMSDMI